jgi:hypothetical protein
MRDTSFGKEPWFYQIYGLCRNIVSIFEADWFRRSHRLRGMLHDEDMYPNSSQFNPERYIERGSNGEMKYVAKEVDPRLIIFGYGRRLVFSA